MSYIEVLNEQTVTPRAAFAPFAHSSIVLPEQQQSYRRVPGDRNYGFEFYGFTDPLALWIEAEVGNRKPYPDRADRIKPLIIEVGGSTGFKAQSLAAQGNDVLVIDRDNTLPFVHARNEILKREHPNAGKIDLVVSDILELNAADIKKACGGRSPAAVASFLCTHFMTDGEVEKFFRLFAEVLPQDTPLGLSYERPTRRANGNNYMHFRSASKVNTIAERSGYGLIKGFPELPSQEGVVRQVFRLNA